MKFWRGGVLVLVVVAMTLLAACGDNGDEGVADTGADEEGEAVAEQGLTDDESEAILNNLTDYEGEEVTVTAVVANAIGERGVLVHGHATAEDQVLVILDEPQQFDEGSILEITGTVQEFNQDTVVGETDVDPSDEAYQPFFGEHVLMAESVSEVQG